MRKLNFFENKLHKIYRTSCALDKATPSSVEIRSPPLIPENAAGDPSKTYQNIIGISANTNNSYLVFKLKRVTHFSQIVVTIVFVFALKQLITYFFSRTTQENCTSFH